MGVKVKLDVKPEVQVAPDSEIITVQRVENYSACYSVCYNSTTVYSVMYVMRYINIYVAIVCGFVHCEIFQYALGVPYFLCDMDDRM